MGGNFQWYKPRLLSYFCAETDLCGPFHSLEGQGCHRRQSYPYLYPLPIPIPLPFPHSICSVKGLLFMSLTSFLDATKERPTLKRDGATSRHLVGYRIPMVDGRLSWKRHLLTTNVLSSWFFCSYCSYSFLQPNQVRSLVAMIFIFAKDDKIHMYAISRWPKNKSIRIVLKTPESHFTFTPLLCDGGQWPNFQKLKVFPILAVFQSKHQKLQNNFGLPLDLTFSMNKIENLASQVKQRGIRWQKFGNNCQNKCFSRSKAKIYCDREFIYG